MSDPVPVIPEEDSLVDPHLLGCLSFHYFSDGDVGRRSVLLQGTHKEGVLHRGPFFRDTVGCIFCSVSACLRCMLVADVLTLGAVRWQDLAAVWAIEALFGGDGGLCRWPLVTRVGLDKVYTF